MTHAAKVYATLDDWIAHEAIPFSLASRPDFNAAVDKVIDSLGDSVALLGFGEALHGGEELLVLRNQLFQRLVEAHGYSAIAIESSFPRGPIINEYVLGRGPASYEAVQDTGFSHGFGTFEANRELVEWMRHYNADPAHPRKLQFYGFDSPTDVVTDSPRQTLHFALDYLSSVDDATRPGVSKSHRPAARTGRCLGKSGCHARPDASDRSITGGNRIADRDRGADCRAARAPSRIGRKERREPLSGSRPLCCGGTTTLTLSCGISATVRETPGQPARHPCRHDGRESGVHRLP